MTTWLTQDAYDRLKSEYEQLAGEGRTSISKKIEAAREEGDLKENGGYHAAKEEQGKMEARIKQLRHLLETAQVGEAPAADGTVKAGMVVSVEFVGGALDGEKEQFLLGSREQAGDVDIEVYSAQSPLGGAVLDGTVGSEADYSLPNGKQMRVRILDAQPFGG
ncbi:MAG TPA: transcription elongation factor GreA [Actinomycetes bacterium]